MSDKDRRYCFEYVCEKYPDCELAAGSCCAIDDFFSDRTIGASECYDLQQKPLFREKKKYKFDY
ncbi:MAG: hypothetical protein K6E13_03700 [Lachnospiraceae bacterium]|nr:hypothetical protein [Lachnospiraceae bacterium]